MEYGYADGEVGRERADEGKFPPASSCAQNPAGTPYQDNWIGMANNINGATKWLHVGGITDGGVRRLAFSGDLAYLSGSVGVNQRNPSERLEIAGECQDERSEREWSEFSGSRDKANHRGGHGASQPWF